MLFSGCSSDKPVGLLEPGDRLAPLTPAGREELESRGAQCGPNSSGPVLCNWSSGSTTCSMTFDAADALTHLTCSIDGLGWECTRPSLLYACSWSDDPDCAELYDVDGVFLDYLCGDALHERLNQYPQPDGGPGRDAGPSFDAAFPDPDAGPGGGDGSLPGGDGGSGPDDAGVSGGDGGSGPDDASFPDPDGGPGGGDASFPDPDGGPGGGDASFPEADAN